jgi:hypothetical protein
VHAYMAAMHVHVFSHALIPPGEKIFNHLCPLY